MLWKAVVFLQSTRRSTHTIWQYEISWATCQHNWVVVWAVACVCATCRFSCPMSIEEFVQSCRYVLVPNYRQYYVAPVPPRMAISLQFLKGTFIPQATFLLFYCTATHPLLSLSPWPNTHSSRPSSIPSISTFLVTNHEKHEPVNEAWRWQNESTMSHIINDVNMYMYMYMYRPRAHISRVHSLSHIRRHTRTHTNTITHTNTNKWSRNVSGQF